jgi:hypothetical protein
MIQLVRAQDNFRFMIEYSTDIQLLSHYGCIEWLNSELKSHDGIIFPSLIAMFQAVSDYDPSSVSPYDVHNNVNNVSIFIRHDMVIATRFLTRIPI